MPARPWQGSISRRALLAATADVSASLAPALIPGRARAATASPVATGIDYSWGRPSFGVTSSLGYAFAISGIPNGGGTSQVVVTGIDGNVYHNVRYASGVWQGWMPMSGYLGASSFQCA